MATLHREQDSKIKIIITKFEAFFGKDCTVKTTKCLAENQSCVIYWILMFLIFLLIITYEETAWVNVDPHYEAVPVDFSGIDNF